MAAATSSTRAEISGFLDQKRIAVVGVSREKSDYSRMLFRELAKRGYDIVPVNPAAEEIDGVRSFARVADVAPSVDAALVLLPAEAADQAVQECVAVGIPRIWSRKVVAGAADLCRERGVSLVAGYCPFMFLPGTAVFHRLHGLTLRLAGRYPS